MGDKSSSGDVRSVRAHEEAAARHMEAAVRWRDQRQPRLAVIEVKHAMLERQLAQLAHERAELKRTNSLIPATTSAGVPADTSSGADAEGDIQVTWRDDGWHVEIAGPTPQTDSVHEFRIAAVVAAHELARATQRNLAIRGRNGAVRELVTYRDEAQGDQVTHKRRHELRRA